MSLSLTYFDITAIAAVLFEDRLGCLENQMAVEVQDFIEAVGKMFLTGHQLMVFAKMHQRLGTKPWKTHVQSWDTIYRVGQYNKVHFCIPFLCTFFIPFL